VGAAVVGAEVPVPPPPTIKSRISFIIVSIESISLLNSSQQEQLEVGLPTGASVDVVGDATGDLVGELVGALVGELVGDLVGELVGDLVGEAVGAEVDDTGASVVDGP
jgi:hypothetical protein